MPYVITGFALVIAALLVVARVLMRLTHQHRMLSHRYSQLLGKLSTVDKSLKQSEPAAILAAVAALDGVVGKLAKSMRSQFGTLHAKVAELEKTSGPDAPADSGERPTRDALRVQYLRPPLPPTAE